MMNDYTQAFLKIIEDNKKIIEKKIEKNPDYIIELMQHSIKCGSNILYKEFDNDKGRELELTRKENKYFTNKLYKTWKKPIDYFEALIELI